MKEIKRGIVFSYDIKRILSGVNAFDYQYQIIPSGSVIDTVRDSFRNDVNKIFNGEVTIISEDEMLGVNEFIGGEYPHHNIR